MRDAGASRRARSPVHAVCSTIWTAALGVHSEAVHVREDGRLTARLLPVVVRAEAPTIVDEAGAERS